MITDQELKKIHTAHTFFTSPPDYNLLPFGKQWCVISQLDLERRLLSKGSFKEVHNLLTEVSNFSLSCCNTSVAFWSNKMKLNGCDLSSKTMSENFPLQVPVVLKRFVPLAPPLSPAPALSPRLSWSPVRCEPAAHTCGKSNGWSGLHTMCHCTSILLMGVLSARSFQMQAL